MSTHSLAARVLDLLAQADPSVEGLIECTLDENPQATHDDLVAAVLAVIASRPALLRTQRLLEEAIRTACAEPDPLEHAFGQHWGEQHAAEARRLLQLAIRASFRLDADARPSLDLIAQNVANHESLADQRPTPAPFSMRVDLAARQDDGRVDLGKLREIAAREFPGAE